MKCRATVSVKGSEEAGGGHGATGTSGSSLRPWEGIANGTKGCEEPLEAFNMK